MKHIIKIAVTMVCLIPALCSCVVDHTDDRVEGISTIKIATKAALFGDEKDDKISSLRIIAFDNASGAVSSNVLYPESKLSTNIIHKMKAGTFDFFFLANEPSAMLTTLDNISAKSDLNSINLPVVSFASDVDIPMSLSKEDIVVLSESNGVIDGGTTYTNWQITLERLAVRFDINMGSHMNMTGRFLGVKFENIPDNVPLIGNYSGARTTERTFTLAANAGYFNDAELPAGLLWGKNVVRVILPSNVFSPKNQSSKAVKFTVLTDTGYNPTCTLEENIAGNDYTLPRNTYYTVSASVQYPIAINIDARPWGTVNVNGNDKKRYLNVSAVSATITDRTMARIFFWTDQKAAIIEPKGYKDATGTTEFTVNDDFENLTGAGVENFHFDASAGKGYFDVYTTTMTTGGVRRIYLNANGLVREIIINANFTSTDLPAAGVPYVGTFHRWNQTGERVIYFDNDVTKTWVAEIDNSTTDGSWVKLTKERSTDQRLYSANPDDAENHQIINGINKVSGKGRVFFRVGLTGVNGSDENAAPRYAKIKLTLNGGTDIKYMYVRQGEAADYLMRKDETGTLGSTMASRPNVQKFSPYNLGDPSKNMGMSTSTITPLAVRGGAFVDFPTKVGYFFQFNSLFSNRAYNPGNPTAISGWISDQRYPIWNPSLNETCPSGFRRMTDIGVNVATSELRQSLMLAPVNGEFVSNASTPNMISGYYADGYFDRQRIVSSVNNIPNTTVSPGTPEVAYFGNILFNPATNTSLFFPCGGWRFNGSSGVMVYAGSHAIFWTSTVSASPNDYAGQAFTLLSNPSSMNLYYSGAAHAKAIRCVAE